MIDLKSAPATKEAKLTWAEYARYRLMCMRSRGRAKQLRGVMLRRKLIELNTPLPAAARQPLLDGPLIVVGLFSSPFGLGSAARNLVASLRREHRELFTVDVSKTILGKSGSLAWNENLPPADLVGGTVVVCLNPREAFTYFAKFDSVSLKHRKLVGYWFWELESLPEEWIDIGRHFDEVWCASEFILNAVKRSLWKAAPDLVLKFVQPILEDLPKVRRTLEPDEVPGPAIFRVVAAFDMGSVMMRKNPLGALRAFRRAFGNDMDKQLIIKMKSAHVNSMAANELIAEIGDGQNIRVVTEDLTRDEFMEMLAQSNAFISLHRSEGLGLVLVESMALGVPVISTAWSGPVDFLTSTNSCLVDYELRHLGPNDYAGATSDARWAEPSIEHAAEWLRKLQASPALCRQIGREGQATAYAKFA